MFKSGSSLESAAIKDPLKNQAWLSYLVVFFSWADTHEFAYENSTQTMWLSVLLATAIPNKDLKTQSYIINSILSSRKVQWVRFQLQSHLLLLLTQTTLYSHLYSKALTIAPGNNKISHLPYINFCWKLTDQKARKLTKMPTNSGFGLHRRTHSDGLKFSWFSIFA